MSDQLKNILAQVLTGIGMYFVGRGWITQELLINAILPGALSLVGVAYSIYLNTRGVKVASVAAVPGTNVELPKAERELAASLPSNVTSK